MTSIGNLLAELDERTIANRIGIRHDEARMRYPLTSNTVKNFDEFNQIISDYYNYHFSICVSQGGSLLRSEASSRAKKILEREYRRSNGDIVTAYNNSVDGIDGGLRQVLDIICEGIKTEAIENYIRDVFDRHVRPNSWKQKVAIIHQFINRCGVHLSSSIRTDQPERYAQNYQELIRTYVNALKTTSSIFRRL